MADKLLFILLNTLYVYIACRYYRLFWNRKKERRIFMAVSCLAIFLVLNGAYLLVFNRNDWIQFSATISITLILTVGMIFQNWLEYVFEKAEDYQNQLNHQQAGYYARQYQEIERKQEMTRIQRHELKNSYITIETMARQGDTQGIIAFVHERFQELDQQYSVVQTGNIAVDAVLNYKLSMAQQLEIQTEQSFNIPVEMSLSPIVLCAVLGNGMDNAIEACRNLPKSQRWISVSMAVEKRNLFIEIVNTFDGKIRSDSKGKIQTRKEDTVNHGFGLDVMRRLLHEKNGTMMVHWENNRFHLQVIIYHVI